MRISRLVKVLLITFAIVSAFIALFFSWKAYRDSQPQTYINFKTFIPTKIVGNLQIKEKNLEIWEMHPLLWFHPKNVVLRFRLGPTSFIAQSKPDGDTNIDTTRFSCSAVGASCFSKTTAMGQTYQLMHIRTPANLKAEPLVYDKLSTQSVTFTKDNTSISVKIETDSVTPFSDEDWSAMIDSFVPVSPNDFRVKHMRPGP